MSDDPLRADGTLTDHLGYWLRVVSNHVSGAFAEKLGRHGTSVAEWVCLRELADHEGMTPSLLAERLGMTRGGITKLIDRLVGRGLAGRNAHATDQRAQVLALTPAGRRLVPVLTALAERNERECFGHLPPETLRRMTAILRDLAEHHGLRSAPQS